MTSGRIGSAVGGRVIPGTASRLLESAMQVNTVFCIQSLIAEKVELILFIIPFFLPNIFCHLLESSCL